VSMIFYHFGEILGAVWLDISIAVVLLGFSIFYLFFNK
jgi:hypothetical protein